MTFSSPPHSGKHRQAAKTEIEKLDLEQLTCDQLIREAARILISVREEGKEKNFRLEIGIVGETTNGLHKVIFSAERPTST